MQKRILMGIMLIALLAHAPVRAPFTAQVLAVTPIAVLLSCQGNVTIHRSDGIPIKGAFGLSLSAGDEVRTGAGSVAEILFEDGNMIQMGAGSKMQVKGPKLKAPLNPPSEPAATLGKGSFQTVQNFLKLKDTEGTSSIARLRSDNKSAEITAESPSQTRIMDGHPTFKWSAAEDAGELRLTIYGEDGVHWTYHAKSQSSVTYPADAPALVPGVSYSWTLETTDPLQYPPLRSAAAFFEVLPVGEAESLAAALDKIAKQDKPSESAHYLLRASLFYNHGLMADAIDETQKALEADSENPILQSILAQLYAEVGRTEDAFEIYQLLESR